MERNIKAIIIIFILLLICIPLVSASNRGLSFSSIDDFNLVEGKIYPVGQSVVSATQSSTGGNQYMFVQSVSGCTGVPYASIIPVSSGDLEASGTLISFGYAWGYTGKVATVEFLDSNHLFMLSGSYPVISPTANVNQILIPDTKYHAGARYLVKVLGSSGYLFYEGEQIGNTTPWNTNPSYIGFGSYYGYSGCTYNGNALWDDLIWGDTAETAYIFGQPQPDGFYIKKDLLVPSTSGLYNANGTLINSFNMFASYSKGSGTPETVRLINFATGLTYQTHSTGSNWYDSFTWNLTDFIYESGAPYGQYATTIAGTGITSPVITYIAGGATITWDRSTYNQGDTATITYLVSPSYWDPATYDYSIKIKDVYGSEIKSQPIFTTSGTFVETLIGTTYNDNSIYYTMVYAIKKSDGTQIPMNFDYMEMDYQLIFTGYVMNAETGVNISGASVNISQNSVASTVTTLVDGTYNSSGWTNNYLINITTTKTGYTTNILRFTPLEKKTTPINISLMPSSPSLSGVSIGGIIRDNAYSRPINGATVEATNSTYSDTRNTITNIAGYYRFNSLVNNRLYKMHSSKMGFLNSTDYYVTAVGV